MDAVRFVPLWRPVDLQAGDILTVATLAFVAVIVVTRQRP